MQHRVISFAGRAAGLSLSILLAACGGNGDRVERQLKSYETRLTALRADQDRLEERLAALELQPARPRLTADAPRAAAGMTRPRLKVIRLGPDEPEADALPAPESRPIPHSAEPEPEDPRPVIRGQGDRVIRTDGTSATGETSRHVVSRGEYEAALSLLRSGEHKNALNAFEDFLKKNPRDPYADNALYWMGECHLRRGEYNESVQRFSEVVQRYPHGNKAVDARARLDSVMRSLSERQGVARRSGALAERVSLYALPASKGN